MKKEHTYVECAGCKWQIEQNIVPGRDWNNNPCPRCKNTRLMIDPKELLCNLCGEGMCPDITVPSGKWISDSPHGLYNAHVVGGYESYHLFDMTKYTFSFCEKCLRQLFKQCKAPPRLNDLDIGDDLEYTEGAEREWNQDLDSYEHRIWHDMGGHHQAYLDRKCNTKKDCPNRAIYTRIYNDHDFTEDCCCEEHKPEKTYSNYSYIPFIPNVLKAFL